MAALRLAEVEAQGLALVEALLRAEVEAQGLRQAWYLAAGAAEQVWLLAEEGLSVVRQVAANQLVFCLVEAAESAVYLVEAVVQADYCYPSFTELPSVVCKHYPPTTKTKSILL